MNIDFKAECDRQVNALDDELYIKCYRSFEKAGCTPQRMFRSVCVTTAKHAVSEYWQIQDDKFHRENPDWEPMDYEGQLAEQAEADFRQGQRDVERWHEDKQLFGSVYAEKIAEG